MKNLLLVLIVVLSLRTTWGQQNENMLFISSNQSREAFNNNIFLCYESVDRKNGYKIFEGEDTISFPYYTTVKMEVVGGTFWVIQEPWTVFITRRSKITRRFDCRNIISGFYRLYPRPDNPPPQQEKSVSVKTDSINVNVNVDVKVDNSSIPLALAGIVEEDYDWTTVIIVGIITIGAVAIAWICKPIHETATPTAATVSDTGWDGVNGGNGP